MPSKRSAPPTEWEFVDENGRALDFFPTGDAAPPPPPARRPAKRPPAPAAVVPATPRQPGGLTAADIEAVWEAACLAGAARGQTWLASFLRLLGRLRSDGSPFSAADVERALRVLQTARRVVFPSGASGWQVPLTLQQAALPGLLAQPWAAKAWRARMQADSAEAGGPGAARRAAGRHMDEAIALARLFVYSAPTLAMYEAQQAGAFKGVIGVHAMAFALVTPFMPALWDRAEPRFQYHLLAQMLPLWEQGQAAFEPLTRWLQTRVASAGQQVPPALRWFLADSCLQRGDTAGLHAALQEAPAPEAAVWHAAALARQGRFDEAKQAFAPALAALGAAHGVTHGARPELMPRRVLEWNLLALLASPQAADWQEARRLSMAASGERQPRADGGWGVWAHAVAVRLREQRAQPQAFEPMPLRHGLDTLEHMAQRAVLAAWAGHRTRRWDTPTLTDLREVLLARGQPGWAALLQEAAQRMDLPLVADEALAAAEAPLLRFFGAAPEPWREALAAIRALEAAPGSAHAAPALQWLLRTDGAGRLLGLAAQTRPIGPRGPGKPRNVALARLRKDEDLAPHDAAVARCIAPYGRRSQPGVDLAGAAMALVGHPALYLDDDLSQPVELQEALPHLEVLRQSSQNGQSGEGGDEFVFKLHDPIGGEVSELDGDYDFDDPDDVAHRRNAVRVLRDAPGRARLLRINPAQRRVAELVARRWAVPVSAQGELEEALRVLSSLFQLHSDAGSGHELPSEPRLRALLAPQGAGLSLRLAVQPFGSFGPLLQAGHGRDRLLAVHEGLHVVTQRDLAAERAHRQAVLDALPALAEDDAADGNADTWLLAEPATALAVLEALPNLPAIASIEWPRGKPVRVLPLADEALAVSVSSGTDWLALSGEVAVEEGRVLSLQWLVEQAHANRQGRFVALGDGQYLALTDALRRQLADLHALAQNDGDGGLKLPASAAGWLASTLDGGRVSGDDGWRARVKALDEAAALTPQVPATLQAELRSYQADGFTWMARLAHAGLGACLADDMGLGKTVQTLALLLHRAALGPALVLAPTSVCANWAIEAARFAPSLTVTSYGEAEDRAAALASPGAGQLVIASYALAHIDSEAFERIEWATLVLDEAQALKNAATQRAKSVARLSAGFRLALTGTPVENRLADLWSIFNLLNPGLLGTANRFNERFAAPIERQRDDVVRARLRRVVAPFLLRRTKAQVLSDLPPRTEIVHRVVPGSEERAFLEAMRRAAVDRVAAAAAKPDGHAGFQVLAELMRLRRAACDPRLVAPELGIVGAKALEFEQLAIELVAGRHKALVFSQFTDFLKLLGERLTAAGLSFQYLDGSTPAAERAKRVAAFQAGEGDLFLISLKAGGFGLNLTAADYVLIVDPWWNPAAEDQALGRAHRIGQLRPVTVYRLVTAGSVEERIVTLHHDKRALADGVLEGQDGGAALTAADLEALLSEV